MNRNQTKKNHKETDTTNRMEIRDRAMLDLACKNELSPGELARLTVLDVDANARCIRINNGKGIRTVPLDALTRKHLWQYVSKVRGLFVKPQQHERALFVSAYDAEAMSPMHLQKTIEYYARRAGMSRNPGKGR